jgi:formylglycine-generating enzyme
MNKSLFLLLLLLALNVPSQAQDDTETSNAGRITETFYTGAKRFTLDFTPIGNPGNPADTNGYGSVSTNYYIGTYVISRNQFNSAMSSGSHGMENPEGDKPATGVTWYRAAVFVNWLNTSQGYPLAYNLTGSGDRNTRISIAFWKVEDPGYDPGNPLRNSLAKFFLPSENEWYKAAYYDPDLNEGAGGYYRYPVGANIAPNPVASGTNEGTAVYSRRLYPGHREDYLEENNQGPASVYQAGGLSPYGTMGQGGNVCQWTETTRFDKSNPNGRRRIRGSPWFDLRTENSSYGGVSSKTPDVKSWYDEEPTFRCPYLGFRVGEKATSSFSPTPARVDRQQAQPIQPEYLITLKGLDKPFEVVDRNGKPVSASVIPDAVKKHMDTRILQGKDGMGMVIANVTLPSGERDSEYYGMLVGYGWNSGIGRDTRFNIGTAQHPDIVFIRRIHSSNWPCYFELIKGELIKGELIKGELIKGELIKGELNKGVFHKSIFFKPIDIQIPHIDPANKIIWLGDVRP